MNTSISSLVARLAQRRGWPVLAAATVLAAMPLGVASADTPQRQAGVIIHQFKDDRQAGVIVHDFKGDDREAGIIIHEFKDDRQAGVIIHEFKDDRQAGVIIQGFKADDREAGIIIQDDTGEGAFDDAGPQLSEALTL